MVRVLSPLAVALTLLLLALSAAAAVPGGTSAIDTAMGALAAAQPRMLTQSEAVFAVVPVLPSTSTADPFGLMVGFALLAAAGAFILTVRRRIS